MPRTRRTTDASQRQSAELVAVFFLRLGRLRRTGLALSVGSSAAAVGAGLSLGNRRTGRAAWSASWSRVACTSGTANEVPHLGHLTRLPARSGWLVRKVVWHSGQQSLVRDITFPRAG